MSLRPAAIIERDGEGLWVVIDDGSAYEVALVMPVWFAGRRVLPREKLKELGTIHEIGSVFVCTEIGCTECLSGYSREPGFCSLCHVDLTEIKQGETLAGV